MCLSQKHLDATGGERTLSSVASPPQVPRNVFTVIDYFLVVRGELLSFKPCVTRLQLVHSQSPICLDQPVPDWQGQCARQPQERQERQERQRSCSSGGSKRREQAGSRASHPLSLPNLTLPCHSHRACSSSR